MPPSSGNAIPRPDDNPHPISKLKKVGRTPCVARALVVGARWNWIRIVVAGVTVPPISETRVEGDQRAAIILEPHCDHGNETGLPNGSRLHCGALKKDSFPNLRAPSASSAC